MNAIWLLGFSASAIGMLSGGAIAWLFQGWQRGTPTIFSVCSGMIFGLVTMEILPESIEIGGWFIAIVGLIFGYFIYKHLEKVSHHVIIITNDAKKRLIRTFWSIFNIQYCPAQFSNRHRTWSQYTRFID